MFFFIYSLKPRGSIAPPCTNYILLTPLFVIYVSFFQFYVYNVITNVRVKQSEVEVEVDLNKAVLFSLLYEKYRKFLWGWEFVYFAMYFVGIGQNFTFLYSFNTSYC